MCCRKDPFDMVSPTNSVHIAVHTGGCKHVAGLHATIVCGGRAKMMRETNG